MSDTIVLKASNLSSYTPTKSMLTPPLKNRKTMQSLHSLNAFSPYCHATKCIIIDIITIIICISAMGPSLSYI